MPMKEPEKNKQKRIVLGPVATVFASVNTGSWRILRPQVNPSLCVGCRLCQSFCPTGVIEVLDTPAEGKVSHNLQIDWHFCKGCGICANVCPQKCIQMVKEEK